MGEDEGEGSVFIFLDEVEGFAGEAVGEVFALFARDVREVFL